MDEFEEIRCFDDSEVAGRLLPLANEPRVKGAVMQLMPELDWSNFEAQLKQINTIDDFQIKIIGPFVHRLAERTCKSTELKNADLTDPNHASLYITNHRDIVLDSAFLNTLLIGHGIKTAEIAIGDNLLIYPWIRDLVRLNKSFIVKRSVPVRQMLEVSKVLSRYIHHVIADKNNPVWIAQREGRSKDSSDQTQASVIKMLALGGASRSIVENIHHLNLQPVALSYEFDPCDYLKASEFQLKRDNADYKKTQAEDLQSMATGLFGYKGRVIFTITPQLNPLLERFPAEMDKNAQVNAICAVIDEALHRNMHLFEINYVAYDLRFQTDKYADKYTVAQKEAAIEYLNGQMAKINVPNRDDDFLWERLLTMYSNPVVNFENVKQK
jgi:hypothetical protein